jgi:TatD DNase family protein
MIIDTHTHLYLEEFQPNEADAVNRAIEAGVDTLIFPNVDLTTIEPMKALQRQFPTNIYMAMGLHPTEVNGNWLNDLKIVEDEYLNNINSYVAIGEIGIDLYWDKTYREQQMLAFERQAKLAAEHDVPIIIHCRDGLNEALEVLRGLNKVPRGVFHSFGGTNDDVDAIRAVGDFYFGINGIVTFKNSKLREVLPHIGIDRLLLETDSPYLAPVPHRGKRNESAFIIHTAQYVAMAMDTTLEHVAEVTSSSARTLFNL